MGCTTRTGFWTASPSPWGTPTLRLNLTTSVHAGTAVRPLQLQCTSKYLAPLSLSQFSGHPPCRQALHWPLKTALFAETAPLIAVSGSHSQQGAYRLCDAPRSLFPSGTVEFHGCASTSLPGCVCKHVPFAQIHGILRMRRSVHPCAKMEFEPTNCCAEIALFRVGRLVTDHRVEDDLPDSVCYWSPLSMYEFLTMV